ncbi:MAG: hypothetical protein IKK52_00930 [Alphaproteobacteria bacterium]|nr:hypothetical protein [Alphaproteobacteria bacterium]
MKKVIMAVMGMFLISNAAAEDDYTSSNLLFDDSDIIVRAETSADQSQGANEQSEEQAVSSAKALLNQTPRKLIGEDIPAFNSIKKNLSQTNSAQTFPAPFGLLWNASVATTRNQGVVLDFVEIKDHPNSYQASRLPKMVDFFDRVYLSFGDTDELYRILAYSQLVDDDASANKILTYYKTYSEYLNKKYGNMKQEFTPAKVAKKVRNAQGKEIITEEDAPIGNPEFLTQLENGTAVLFSTYHNDKIEVTLSISVDGDQKSYIVIDYSNLQVIKQQENSTIDAL